MCIYNYHLREIQYDGIYYFAPFKYNFTQNAYIPAHSRLLIVVVVPYTRDYKSECVIILSVEYKLFIT